MQGTRFPVEGDWNVLFIAISGAQQNVPWSYHGVGIRVIIQRTPVFHLSCRFLSCSSLASEQFEITTSADSQLLVISKVESPLFSEYCNQ